MPMTILVAISLAAGGAGPSDPPGREAEGPTDRTARIELLVRELGHPNWRTREAATEELMDFGPATYDSLRRVYRSGCSYEVRRRIKKVAEEVYLSAAAGPAPAFLGIRIGTGDPRTPAETAGVPVAGVLASTAAERAGLKAGDLILSLNGDWLMPDNPARGLPAWIQTQTPRSHCTLGVLRGGEGRLLTDELRSLPPEAWKDLEWKIATSDEDPRIPAGRAALLVTRDAELRSPGWKVQFEAGDLIWSLDNKLISADSARETIDHWLESPPTERREEAPVPQPRPGNAPEPPSGRSAHVLHGGDWITLDVALGRRPEAASTSTEPRNEAERRERRQAFDVWWRDTFETAEAATPRRIPSRAAAQAP